MNQDHLQQNDTGTSAVLPDPSHRNKYLATVGSILIGALLVVISMYLWQDSKVKDAESRNEALSSQLHAGEQSQTGGVSSSASAAGTKGGSSVIVPDMAVVTGQADQDSAQLRSPGGKDIFIEGYILPSEQVQEAWVEYGTDPADLHEQTPRRKNELGLGNDNQYRNYTFTIKKDGLAPGTNYFYRVAAKTTDKTIIYGGTAAFTSLK